MNNMQTQKPIPFQVLLFKQANVGFMAAMLIGRWFGLELLRDELEKSNDYVGIISGDRVSRVDSV